MRVATILSVAAVAALLFVSATPTQAKSRKKKKDKNEYTDEQVNLRIKAGLEWLVDHQGPEGQWSYKDFSKHSKRVRAKKTFNLQWVKPGEEGGDSSDITNHDVAGTSLGLLCFAGSGYDHKEGDYKAYIRAAVLLLRKVQDNNGCFGQVGKACMLHDSAIATMAMAEIYGLSEDKVLKPVVDKGVEYLLKAQNPGSGWRYGVQPGQSDTQMTGWVLLALKTAKLAGIEADYETAWDGADKWFTKVSGEIDGKFHTGYMFPGDTSPRQQATASYAKTPSMDAVHVLCRLLSGDKKWGTKNKDLKEQAKLLMDSLPEWKENTVDLPYWYYATLALYQFGGKDWEKWCDKLTETLMENQRGYTDADTDTFEAVLDEFGSWDDVDAWYPVGGRVWSTAACTMMLQVIARYRRLK
jgi:hypothetical protein